MKKLLVSKESISKKVTDILRKQILLGEIERGYHLSELKLSEMLAISRGPVREAIQALENEGLVFTPNNGRTVVVGLTEKDLKDLFAVRLNLESTAINTIIAQKLNRNLTQLSSIIENMKKETNPIDRIALDVEFHFQLMNLTQNRTLIKLWSVIRDLVSTLIEITLDYFESMEDVNDIHERIIEAIGNNQAEQAVQMLTVHFETGIQVISSHIHKFNTENSISEKGVIPS